MRKNKEEDGMKQSEHQPMEKRRGSLEGATGNAVCGKRERMIGAGADERRSRGQSGRKGRNKGRVTTRTIRAIATQRRDQTP